MTKDQTWVTQHFEELVSKYGGKFVAIVNKTVVAVGESPKEVYEKAQAQFPNATPSILPVPKEEELTCILWSPTGKPVAPRIRPVGANIPHRRPPFIQG